MAHLPLSGHQELPISAVLNWKLKKIIAGSRSAQKNLANIDLFAITPAFISAAIDTSTYSEIELKVLLVKSPSGAIPLTLKGSYTSSTGTVIPTELDFNDDAFIKAKAENIHVDGKTDLATTIKFHLNRLVAGITAPVLDAATQTGGAIVISNSVNVDIYNKMKANLTLSGEFKGFEHHDKSERKHDN